MAKTKQINDMEVKFINMTSVNSTLIVVRDYKGYRLNYIENKPFTETIDEKYSNTIYKNLLYKYNFISKYLPYIKQNG
jgi:hypothetical protein